MQKFNLFTDDENSCMDTLQEKGGKNLDTLQEKGGKNQEIM